MGPLQVPEEGRAMALVKSNKTAVSPPSMDVRTAEEWSPRITAMLAEAPGEWVNATESWGITVPPDVRAIQGVLWRQFRSDDPNDNGYRMQVRVEKLTNRVKDPKTGVTTPALKHYHVRLVRRGAMAELENDRLNEGKRYS